MRECVRGVTGKWKRKKDSGGRVKINVLPSVIITNYLCVR